MKNVGGIAFLAGVGFGTIGLALSFVDVGVFVNKTEAISDCTKFAQKSTEETNYLDLDLKITYLDSWIKNSKRVVKLFIHEDGDDMGIPLTCVWDGNTVELIPNQAAAQTWER